MKLVTEDCSLLSILTKGTLATPSGSHIVAAILLWLLCFINFLLELSWTDFSVPLSSCVCHDQLKGKMRNRTFGSFLIFLLLAVWGCKLQRKHLFIGALSRSLFIFTWEERGWGIKVMEEIWLPVQILVQGSYILNLSWSWSFMSSKINP